MHVKSESSRSDTFNLETIASSHTQTVWFVMHSHAPNLVLLPTSLTQLISNKSSKKFLAAWFSSQASADRVFCCSVFTNPIPKMLALLKCYWKRYEVVWIENSTKMRYIIFKLINSIFDWKYRCFMPVTCSKKVGPGYREDMESGWEQVIRFIGTMIGYKRRLIYKQQSHKFLDFSGLRMYWPKVERLCSEESMFQTVFVNYGRWVILAKEEKDNPDWF